MKRKTVLRTQRVKRRKRRFNPFRIIWSILSGAVKLVIIFFLLAGVSLFFTYSYHYLVSSPLLKLEEIHIKGTDTPLKERIIKLCGLDKDVSLLTLRLDEMRKMIERDPWVRDVRLERRFPHKLIIEVEMERPYALVLMDGLYYMNQWGEVFKQLEPGDEVDYPVVTGISGPGVHIQKQLKTAAEIIRILKVKKNGKPLERLSEVHVADDEHLSLYFSNFPAEVQVTVKNFDMELKKLNRIVTHLQNTGRLAMVNRINLSSRVGAVVSFGRG